VQCKAPLQLTEPNQLNVHRLQEEDRFGSGIIAGHESQPLVVNGAMQVVNRFPNKLYALDPDGLDVL
jgi:hypothetical protein